VAKCLSDFRPSQSEQALTAARPYRLLTGFPFDYPKEKLRDLKLGYIFFKEHTAEFLAGPPEAVN
jgi:hypothetical protein